MEGRGRVLKMSPDVGLNGRPWRVRSIDIDRRRGWPRGHFNMRLIAARTAQQSLLNRIADRNGQLGQPPEDPRPGLDT